MKRFFIFLWILVLILPMTSFGNPGNFLSNVKEVTLPNGMKFLLLRRTGAPVFSAYIRVKVGGIDEPDGQTGVAHLLEHMAFKGTSEIGTTNYEEEKKLLDQLEEIHSKLLRARGEEKTQLKQQMAQVQEKAEKFVVKEEFSKAYQRNGGSNLNANTSEDMTSYFVSLPNTKLKLWAYLESSRLKDPVFREFYSERDVVGEERRMRVDDSSFGKLYEEFLGEAFQKSPYRRPTIGYSRDIEKLSATDLKNFYQKYYVPSNMVGAIVGDIDLSETEKILNETFGILPKGTPPPKVQVSEPNPNREKEIVVPFDAQPALMIGYPKPTIPHRDDYIFDVLDQILCEGRTSRFYKRLVDEDRLVQKIACSDSTPGSRLNNLYFIYASILQGHNAHEVIKVIDEELQRILKEGVPPEELEKAKKDLLAEWYYEMQSNDDMAGLLSYFDAVSGTWRYILDHQKQIQAVTNEDLQRLVQTYLQATQRTIAILKPTKK
jgi:predicted Zn-dependent peptidase